TRLQIDASGSEWQAITYEVSVDGREFLALVKGQPDPDDALCRVHRGSLVADLFSSTPSEGGTNLRKAIQHIDEHGSGVVVYIPSALGIKDELRRLDPGP